MPVHPSTHMPMHMSIYVSVKSWPVMAGIVTAYIVLAYMVMA